MTRRPRKTKAVRKVAREVRKIQVGQETTPLAALVTVTLEGVDLDDAFAPEPDLTNAESAIDVQLSMPPDVHTTSMARSGLTGRPRLSE